MTYTVVIHPEPIEFDIEADTPEQAELNARNAYAYGRDKNKKAEVFEVCEDCQSTFKPGSLMPYKLEPDTFLCENCMDERREE